MTKVKYSRELLADAAKDSYSIAQVIRKLGLKQSGGNHSHIKRRLDKYEIDISHMTGQGWQRGAASTNRLSWQEVLQYDRIKGRKEHSYRLRRALIESGILHICNICGNGGEWLGNKLTLQIDHIDGNPINNIRNNLQFLCPNCHSQTETFGKNIRNS